MPPFFFYCNRPGAQRKSPRIFSDSGAFNGPFRKWKRVKNVSPSVVRIVIDRGSEGTNGDYKDFSLGFGPPGKKEGIKSSRDRGFLFIPPEKRISCPCSLERR